jgi:general secretion pathway protein D
MLITNDNEVATIEIQTELPRIEVTSTQGVGSTSGVTQFDEAGISMNVEPRISQDGYITLGLELDITNFVGESATPGVPPPRQRRRITTWVTVPDGSTVVVGGLKSSTSSKTINKIPLLGDIPLIGELFKSQRTVNRRTNLYMFLRPRILKDANFEDLEKLSLDTLHRAEADTSKVKSKQRDEFFATAYADHEKKDKAKPGKPERHFDYQGLDRKED